MLDSLTRRGVLKLAGLAGAGLILPPMLTRSALAQPREALGTPLGARARALRIAHLSDIHVQPELRAGEGMSACLRHVNALPDKPDLIITGGDQVMDTFDQGHDRTKLLWDLWQSCLKNDNSIPAHHVLGNHDIWGWNRKKSLLRGDEPLYGKPRALEVFGRPKPYTSMDHNGWHIVLLDSIQPDGDGYIGRLDEEQFAWLEQDLASVPKTTPVAVFSHIPIFAVCVFNDGAKSKDDPNHWRVSGGLMHSDALRIRKLFHKHPNVKVCLSGHIHQRDRVEFNGVTYICDGAVSGRWWKGRNAECDEGYGLLDLYPDGTFAHAYQTYGWKAQPAG